MDTFADFVTTVDSTIDGVVAIDGQSAGTLAVLACAGPGAWVVVIAGSTVGWFVITAVNGVAYVGRAGVFVITASAFTNAAPIFVA